ncbi:MAG: HAMP domain-containing protein, partial [Candidatus Obscuribacterales bacterium]|nr:HAMP domain-containing protein [Candidatus Obscuribacterales bacterium]
MAVVMTVSSIVPIVICHVIVSGLHGFNLLDLLWYLPLILMLALINWFLAGIIIAPLSELISSTNKLASMDLRQRLDVDLSESSEILELRKAFNRLLNRLEESLNIQ